MNFWIPEFVGKMHFHKVTQIELATELGCSREYVCNTLNGTYEFRGVKEKFNDALDKIIERKMNNAKS